MSEEGERDWASVDLFGIPRPALDLADAAFESGEAAFEGRAGVSVAIDPRNGEVLAMISVPSFDPNLFVNGISQADYKALLDNPDKPLLDRALRGSYVPGSTVSSMELYWSRSSASTASSTVTS